MGVGKTGNGRKCKTSVWFSESWGKNPKNVWRKVEIRATVRRKEAAWKVELAASNEEAKEICMEAYRKEKRRVKRCTYQRKKKVNEQFGWKMN